MTPIEISTWIGTGIGMLFVVTYVIADTLIGWIYS